jgi:chromosome segregation ATPase
MTDAHGRPEQAEDTDPRTPAAAQQTEDTDPRTTTDAQQTVSLNTQQAAQQLGVDSRTVRRYIAEGIRVSGRIVLLEARQVRTQRGQEWQIYQTDLDQFKQQRDHAATEGQAAGQLTRAGEESQALTVSVQLIAVELERRSHALAEAQQTIERLAHEAGRQAGRNEELERERDALQRRVKELEEERDQWRQKTEAPPKTPYRIRLLPWRSREAES